MKECKRCYRKLPDSEFKKSKKKGGDLTATCKSCLSDIHRRRYVDTRKDVFLLQRVWAKVVDSAGGEA